MPIKLITSGGGSAILTPTSKATDYTLTVPAVTANVITSADSNTITQAMFSTGLAGTGPAFSAYQSSLTSVSSATWTKVAFQTEEFDTANCFDSTTNYRFTPNVAGYYQFNFAVGVASSVTNVGISLYKNGTQYKWPFYNIGAGNITGGSALAYANGTTDYFEAYIYFATGQNTSPSATYTFFQGFMVRAA